VTRPALMPRWEAAERRVRNPLALSDQDSPDALSAALGDPDPDVRAGAALALARLRDPASIPALARIVASWDEPALARCRRAALHALVSFHTEEAAVELARALATGSPGGLDLPKRSALLAVAHAEPSGVAVSRVVRALVALLAHEDQAVTERAASLLMLFPSASHRTLARTLRTAPEADVRRKAAQALGACRQDAAVAALVSALGDPAACVRAAAAHSLREKGAAATAATEMVGQSRRDRLHRV
jgi:hypothetical protein